ncbi:MAG TPA: hypothetical protein VHY37_05930 [Tepidisphaeraceae bacterium]|nr:hypothetical protein [Tepidisphaeraceae bacterium]
MALGNSESATPRGQRIGLLLMVGLLICVAAGKVVLADVLDPDCFWHLRVADQLHTDGIGPLVDRLSFASNPEPWTPYSWLAELAMRFVWRLAGWRGAIFTQAVLESAFIALVALACYLRITERTPGGPSWQGKEEFRQFRAGVATAFALLLSLPYLSFRPATAALVVLAGCSVLLIRDRARQERSAAVWLLIPLSVLAVNLHLYAIFIPASVFMLFVGAVWERSSARYLIDRPEADRRIGRYALLCGLCAAGCLATPMLPGMVSSAMHYQFSDPMVSGPVIAEMQPFYHGSAGKIALIAVLGFACCLIRRPKRLRAGEWAWLAMGTLLLFRLGRFAPIFALWSAPVLAATLPRFSDRILLRRTTVIGMSAIVAILAIRIAAAFPLREPMDQWLTRLDTGAPGYPCGAARYVEKSVHPVTGRIINEFSWGGYLEWRLAGRYQVFLDGRTQLYSPDFWQATYLGSPADRLRFLSQVQADAAILPEKNSEFHDALARLGWRTVYSDSRAQVMLPPATVVKRKDTPLWPQALIDFGE